VRSAFSDTSRGQRPGVAKRDQRAHRRAHGRDALLGVARQNC
jgi:hypothetical protein